VTSLVWAVALASACGGSEGGVGRSGGDDVAEILSLVETLGGLDTAGYARALEVRDFTFPADHGPHPDYRTEWWYVPGNLSASGGRDFGFQLTIFRNALAPREVGGPSTWATRQAFMGHFTVTDVSTGRFVAEERFARGAAGLAGAETTPLRVWIEDWQIEAGGLPASGTQDPAGRSVFPLRIRANGADVGIDLRLERGKPVVLQGENGLSQKGPEPGNASYYYAHTRMPTAGSVFIDGETVDVSGLAWLDREWSTSALSAGQIGWDWFALQLDDGWEMMIYQLRLEDGSADPLSDGVLIDPEGRRLPLTWGEGVTMNPVGTWTSEIDGTRYPSGWRISVPERGWDIEVLPVVDDQELDVSFRYWEGAVRVRGSGEGGAAVTGRGYVELTGYAGSGL